MTDTVTDSDTQPSVQASQPHNLGAQASAQQDAGAMDNKAKYRDGQQALYGLIGPIKWYLTTGRVLAIVSALLSIAPYVALVNLGTLFYTAVQEGTPINQREMWAAILLLVGTFMARLLVYLTALSITHVADLKFRTHLRNLMLDRLARAPLAWFTSINSGRVRKAIQDDSQQIHMLIAHAPVEMTDAMVQPLALLAYAAYIDWRLALVAVINLPVFIAAYLVMMKDMGEKTAEMDTRLDKVSATMVEFVAGISVVKAFGKVGKAHANYRKAAEEFGDFYMAWCLPMLKGNAIALSIISVPVLLVVNLGLGTWLVNAGYVTPVEVLATSMISLLLPVSVMKIAMGTWIYQIAGGAALRIKETLDTPVLTEPANPKTPDGVDVVFDHVHFAYGDTVALTDINLTLHKGTVTALIGPSGSGKSTLATLVARFADPTAGSITIGGVDVRDINTRDLYARVAFVLQDPQLIRASIWDNLRMARPDADDAAIMAAAKAAYIHDEIMAMPKGYETVIGQDAQVSGGQAQRISIARALLIDAPILLLDEATALTDPDTEAIIQKALTELVQDRTVLVIAHRLSAIVGADQIVVLERGKIVAKGTHEDIQANPHYQALLATNTPHLEGGDQS